MSYLTDTWNLIFKTTNHMYFLLKNLSKINLKIISLCAYSSPKSKVRKVDTVSHRYKATTNVTSSDDSWNVKAKSSMDLRL